MLSVANLGGLHDYPELGSKYKGCHVKTLVFWTALQSQRFADENQDDSWHPSGNLGFFRHCIGPQAMV